MTLYIPFSGGETEALREPAKGRGSRSPICGLLQEKPFANSGTLPNRWSGYKRSVLLQ